MGRLKAVRVDLSRCASKDGTKPCSGKPTDVVYEKINGMNCYRAICAWHLREEEEKLRGKADSR